MAWDPDVGNPLGGAIFYWLEITRHLLAHCHDAGGSLLSSSPRTVISLFLLVVDDVDNVRGRRTVHGERTKAARRRTTARPRTEQTGAMEDAPVQSQAEGSMRLDWFGCGCMLGLTSPENNRTCGGIEGGIGQRWRVHTVGRRRRSQAWEAGAGGAGGVVWFGRL